VSAAADALEEGMARTLRTIGLAMGTGLALFAAISVLLYARSSAVVPTAQSLRTINMLTILSAAYCFAAIVASEIAWRKMLAGATPADVNAKTQTAFVVRAAAREGAALLGGVTFFLACQDGVLRAYPAYWADLVPTALFWSFLYVHWPSLENLKAEVAAIAPS
jgi:hypothetical protein